MAVLFSKSRYVSRDKGVQLLGKIPIPVMSVFFVEEAIPGPMPIYTPWVMTNSVLCNYYCW